jgi:lysozyme
MMPSQKCYDLIKSFEGFSLKAYPDPATKAEPYTIGYGTTLYKDGRKVRLGDIITNDVADELLKFDVDKKSLSVSTLTKEATINQNQFDSLVSFAYNCGVANFAKSTLLKKVVAKSSDPSIRDEFMKWNKAAGQVMKGLTRRRESEANLYFS